MDDPKVDEKAVKRAYVMLKMFFALKDTDAVLRERMERWLISDINRQEKDAALQRVFEEMLNGEEGGELGF